ncbi:MAG TPA: ATP phosphoribosyltransferase [Kofleriaceae bacterium]|jgi:ATP phosphoribosyltransferase|nr:ATP phosphoribosyltransferase [Kofleriaceae bacterium]
MGGKPRIKSIPLRGADGQPLVVAMPKGRIFDEAVALFSAAGFDLGPARGESRKLVHDCGPLRLLILRSGDVPTYVEHGAADVGIAGLDVLEEHGSDLYQPLDLGIGACRLVIAEPADRPVDEDSQSHIRIATKYPGITRRWLQRRGITAEIIELGGAVELGPLTGLAHRIVDLVQTGETLAQNGLVEVDTLMTVTSRLVVNPANLKLRTAAISDLIARLERAVHRAARV